jgi:hypothetical protein
MMILLALINFALQSEYPKIKDVEIPTLTLANAIHPWIRLEASPPIATTVLKPTAKARPPYINPLTIPQNSNTYCRLLLIRR